MNPKASTLAFLEQLFGPDTGLDYIRERLDDHRQEPLQRHELHMTVDSAIALRLLEYLARQPDPALRVVLAEPAYNWVELNITLVPDDEWGQWGRSPSGWWLLPDDVARRVSLALTDEELAHDFNTSLNRADAPPADFREGSQAAALSGDPPSITSVALSNFPMGFNTTIVGGQNNLSQGVNVSQTNSARVGKATIGHGTLRGYSGADDHDE